MGVGEMKAGKILFVALIASLFIYDATDSARAFFHNEPDTLFKEIQSGDITLRVGEAVENDGTGAIVFNGYLINKTPNKMQVSTTLAKPLYLNNIDRDEQNLLVTRVYHKAHGYLFRGRTEPKIFTLPGYGVVPVYLFTYCMNYHLGSPDADPGFFVDSRGVPNNPDGLPEWVSRLMELVKEHRLEHKADDIADAVQLALWYKRDGIKAPEARKYLNIDAKDVRWANYFLYRLKDL